MADHRDPYRARKRTIGDEPSSDGEVELAARIEAADARDRQADERDRAAETRDRTADVRDHQAEVREAILDQREVRQGRLQQRLEEREAQQESARRELQAREAQQEGARRELEERRAGDKLASERDRLLVQMREANEHLVLASVRATEAADAADVARGLAADSEERFRSLVTASAAVVWQADVDGSVHVHSESWKAFTGIEAETADPRWGWLVAVHPKDRAHVRDAWTHALSTSTPYLVQHRLQHHGGSYVWVVSRAVPIIKAGVVREWVGMMTDVTDHVRIEEAREQFIGILGHDLRNPVQAILMGAELLAGLPAPYAGVVAKIVRSSHRMEVIIRDVMDFARGRLGGGIPVSVSPCDLERICSDVVAEVKQAYPGRSIGLELVGELHCECDSGRIEQVLSNLLGNAIAHGTDPIRVRVWQDADEIVISVENQGTPIAVTLLPRLFEPFSQGTRDAGARNDGLGLGLYIVSEIIRAHGGTVTVSSSQEGTIFFARFPRDATARARIAAGFKLDGP